MSACSSSGLLLYDEEGKEVLGWELEWPVMVRGPVISWRKRGGKAEGRLHGDARRLQLIGRCV